MVDLAGSLSKPAPSLVRMGSLHRTIRARAARPTQRGLAPVSVHRTISDESLDTVEGRYHADKTLRAIVNDVGLRRHRLSSLLRERDVHIRRAAPSPAEVQEMAPRYQDGESLERIGRHLGFSAGTIRNHLIALGLTLRDPHSRDR